MENNQFNTINLGDNLGANNNSPVFVERPTAVSGAQEPVVRIFNPYVQVAPQQATVQVAQEFNEVQPATTAEVIEEVATENEEVAGPVSPIYVTGDIQVPTVLLRGLVSQARKVGTASNLNPLTEVLNLDINKDGITVRANGGNDGIDFECIDRSYTFEKSLSISLDITVFGEYLNAERNNMLTLDYVEDENTLYINTQSGTRKFPQRVDSSTHQPVVFSLKYPLDYNSMTPVDYTRLREILDLNSSARDLALKTGYDFLKGMYCGEDIIVSSDGNVMVIQPNTTEFNNRIFFMENDLCKLVTGLIFNIADFRVGFVEEDGFTKAIVMSDGRTTICSPVILNEKFPVEVARNFWNSSSLIQSIQVPTKDLYAVIKSVMPFIPKMGDDIDKLSLEISGTTMIVKCLDNTAVEKLTVVNTGNFATGNKPIHLPATKLDKVLQTVKSDTVELLIDAQSDNYICLSYNNQKSIVTTLN